jgi:ribosomal protein S1
MTDILKGIAIGYRNGGLIVQHKTKTIFIPERELGGKEKPNKAKTIIGATIYFKITGNSDSNSMLLGSRKQALEEYKKQAFPEIGTTIEARLLLVLPTVLIVEYLGREIYIKAKECSYSFVNDLGSMKFTQGQKIKAKVIGVNEKAEDPIELSIKALSKDISCDNYQLEDEFHVVINHIYDEKWIIATLPLNGHQIMCPYVKWRIPVNVGDVCVTRITKIIEDENRIYGIIFKAVRRGGY